MENQMIFCAGVRKHKGSLFGMAILLFLAMLFLFNVLIIYLNGSKYIREQIQRAGFGDLTAWVSGVKELDSLTESIQQQREVAGTQTQNLIFTEYKANDVESDSEGQLILWNPEEERYRFFQDDFSGYQPKPQEIAANEVYVSASMISIMDLKIGDSITFPVARGGQNQELTVAGYYEDPFMGSSMIGMKGFLISENTYQEILAVIQAEGMDALAREGAMIHITVDDKAGYSVSDLNQILNENTPLSQYTEFIHSADAILNFMVILQNAFCGLLAAFVVVLLGVAFVVLGHSISGMIEQDWKNFGILKTIGFTGKDLTKIQALQYGIGILAGLLAGVLVSIPMAKIVSKTTVTTSGILIPVQVPVLPCVCIFIGLLLLLGIFIVIRLGRIYFITPMSAIRGEKLMQIEKRQELARHHQIKAQGLMFFLALRQLLSGWQRYISTCLVAVLLVFFASLAGRMNGWLGADGKGMMDAFNPADLDIGVQVLGELSAKKMEQVVASYSEITDSYMLAMPNVSINGTNYTANVISEPKRFHISQGQTSTEADQVVFTETAAQDLGVEIGDIVKIRGDLGTKEFIVSGIYHCANDMGANLGMSREGFLSIGRDDPRLWCYHYFLADVSQKQVITESLENAYGGDVHVHENTWPGLKGIIRAMQLLILFMYGVSAVFICIVTVMAGIKILEAERKDLGIFKSIGFSTLMLRIAFATRFGMAAVVGAVLGTVMAAFLTDPIVSAIMRLAGISNFSSHLTIGSTIMPGIIIIGLFFGFSYLAAGKIKKADMTILTAEQ